MDYLHVTGLATFGAEVGTLPYCINNTIVVRARKMGRPSSSVNLDFFLVTIVKE